MISIDNISKRYKGVQALQEVEVAFTAGQSIAVIGPNGSGKSTLMKSILGLVKPDSGDILVRGASIAGNDAYRAQIGYMPQIVRYPENMRVAHLFHMVQDIRKNPAHTDLELYVAYAIAEMAGKPLGGLSGGMKQKVNAALAFLFDPQMIILDEPTAGLDPLSAELLKNKIQREKDKGKLILISSHIMADLEEIATHVLYMMDGRIAFFKTLAALKSETGSDNLSRAIAAYMSQQITKA